MKQVLQHLRTGETRIADAPRPSCPAEHVLIRTRRTLISAGTERMLVEFSRGGLLSKARQQPERVRQALDRIRTDGLLPTVDAILGKLDSPLAMGYCNAGVVLEVGAGVTDLAPGDRVASNGPHAEIVCVPKRLVAPIPDGVPDEHGAFAVAGAIALQSLRLAEPTLGETAVVSGLGLIGLLAVQCLHANGCRTLGLDYARARLALAEAMGTTTFNLMEHEDPVPAVLHATGGRGADLVIVAAASQSSKPLQHAAAMCRPRGRVVLVGAVGMELNRKPFYEKEISLQVSCSYGPGRYDPAYEDAGHDYPYGHVRWTEERNLQAVLDLMAGGRLDPAPLVSHRLPFAEATHAYDLLAERADALGILLEYPEPAPDDDATADAAAANARTVTLPQPRRAAPADQPVLACIGAGNYAGRVLLPAFAKTGARLKTLVSSGGTSAATVGEKAGFEQASTDADAVFADETVDAVIIATRHDTHAALACRALEAGKHVFVEKPVALTRADVEALRTAYAAAADRERPPILMAGFNRRFAPQAVALRAHLAETPLPKAFVMTVNAGAIPADHWTQDPAVGGGRIVGEAVHFVDLLRWLADAPIARLEAVGLPRPDAVPCDSASLLLGFANGSTGAIHYFANGHPGVPKERLEATCGGETFVLDNFRRLQSYAARALKPARLWRLDKGQRACAAAFVDALRTGAESPIPFEQILEVAERTLDAAGMLRP
ncbi:MAG: bi-domain-containing oxidoreductase [Planctomycetota bacterium]